MADHLDLVAALDQNARDLVRQGHLQDALGHMLEAAELAPTPTRQHNLAVLLQLCGEHPKAEARLRAALEADPTNPQMRALLGLSVLARARLAEGFALYDDWRHIPGNEMKSAPDVGAPLWSGQPLAGQNVLIWGEEGFGDQIMYARFVPLLEQEGANVIWVCHPGLARLVREGLGTTAVAGKGALVIEGLDYAVPSSRLPVVFMQRLETPPPAPYLKLPQPNVIDGLTIGVVARGNPDHWNDTRRSLPPGIEAELMALPGAVSLAPADTGARDFWDTAGIIAGLDLIITVDTAVAHLAGALGKPVWTLLPAIGCDWRWLRDRSDSPWYPTMRLFRQDHPGDWAGVLNQVQAALAARTSQVDLLLDD